VKKVDHVTAFPPIEAGSQIQAGSVIYRSRGLTSNIIELIMVLVHRTVLRCVLREGLQYEGAIPIRDYVIQKFRKANKLHFKITVRSR